MTVASSSVVIVPSPSLSNRENASRNSTKQKSVRKLQIVQILNFSDLEQRKQSKGKKRKGKKKENGTSYGRVLLKDKLISLKPDNFF